MKSLFFIFSLLFTQILYSAPKIGTQLPSLKIDGKDGGKVSGGVWDSSKELGKTLTLIFYVDPDEADTNEKLSVALKERKFDKTKLKSFGFVNMAATWLPYFLIVKILKGKQKKYPETTMVKDITKKVVKKWGFDDESNVVALFDNSKKLLWYKSGAHNEDDIKNVIKLIEDRI